MKVFIIYDDLMTDKEVYFDENRNVIDKPLDDKGDDATDDVKTCDCNGNEILNGDTLVAVKWLPVKWGTDIKKGDKFTNVRLGDDPTHVSANSKKNGKIFLKTEFFKKVG